jgi:autotransporter passenger strand-loop-strand repeat protein
MTFICTGDSSGPRENKCFSGGHKTGVCAQKQPPVAFFPAHWAPNDMKIYKGTQFPAPYRCGAFIAFHGSWNRAPGPQGGNNVVFQPLAGGKASGPYVVFADGFAGAIKDPGRVAYRPSGIAPSRADRGSPFPRLQHASVGKCVAAGRYPSGGRQCGRAPPRAARRDKRAGCSRRSHFPRRGQRRHLRRVSRLRRQGHPRRAGSDKRQMVGGRRQPTSDRPHHSSRCSGTEGPFWRDAATEDVYAGGTSINSTASSNGYLEIKSGGLAKGATINPGGIEIVSAAGQSNGTTINNGNAYVDGLAMSTTVNNGGGEYVDPAARPPTRRSIMVASNLSKARAAARPAARHATRRSITAASNMSLPGRIASGRNVPERLFVASS